MYLQLFFYVNIFKFYFYEILFNLNFLMTTLNKISRVTTAYHRHNHQIQPTTTKLKPMATQAKKINTQPEKKNSGEIHHGMTHEPHDTNPHPRHDLKSMTHHTHSMTITPMTHHTHTHTAKESSLTQQWKIWEEREKRIWEEKEKNLSEKFEKKEKIFWKKKRAEKWAKKMIEQRKWERGREQRAEKRKEKKILKYLVGSAKNSNIAF